MAVVMDKTAILPRQPAHRLLAPERCEGGNLARTEASAKEDSPSIARHDVVLEPLPQRLAELTGLQSAAFCPESARSDTDLDG
jgi:hypothetical protein